MDGRGSSGRRLWVALAVATLAFGPLTSPATVLCRGEDGHVGVEAAFAGCCPEGEQPETGRRAHPRALGSQHPCGGCTDVSLGQPSAQVPRGHSAPPPTTASRLTQPPPSSSVPRCPDPPAVGTPAWDHDLAVVRTTVLLR